MNLLRPFAPVLLLLPALFAPPVAHAESPAKLPKPTASYVSDFAGVIDPASRQSIEDLATQVYTQAHATIVVVTVNSLDGEDIETWTTELEDQWKVGPKGTDKGVVLVFAIKDHKRRIEVGYGLEGILNDARVGDIGRTMVPQLKAGDYGPAILNGVTQIANIIATDAGVTLSAQNPQPPPVYHDQQSHKSHFPWGIVIFVIIFIILSHGHGGGRGGGGGGSGWLWFLAGSMLGGGGGRGGSGFGGGDSGGGGSSGGGDFGGGFGGGSGGGGASGDW